MKKLLLATVLFSSILNAQVIPGINSKGGAMTMPSGKLKVGIKHIYLKKNHMYNGTDEKINRQNLDAKAHITLFAIRYGASDNFDLRIILPYKDIEANAHLGTNNVALNNKE